MIKTEEAIVWYFESSAEVVSGYEQLYRRYTTTPIAMENCAPGEVVFLFYQLALLLTITGD